MILSKEVKYFQHFSINKTENIKMVHPIINEQQPGQDPIYKDQMDRQDETNTLSQLCEV